MKTTTTLLFALHGLLWPAAAAVSFYPAVSGYRSQNDSPLLAGINQGSIYLEDFENPTVAQSIGFASQGANSIYGSVKKGLSFMRSVDGDDGVIDGIGFNGGSFQNASRGPAGARFDINFTPDSLGHYPRYVGFVETYTLSALLAGGPFEEITLYGPNGEDLTGNYRYSGLSPKLYTPLSSPLAIREDVTGATFMGAYADEGISRIRVYYGEVIDHLQYGYSIPEPASCGLVAAAGALLAWRSRRNRTVG